MGAEINVEPRTPAAALPAEPEIPASETRRGGKRRAPGLLLGPKDPWWYKDAIIYEVHVRAFLDANGDGIGDFRGLTLKLDYLQELGVTAVWLLPFYPSPLRDDGYDIADYCAINPLYGTLRDFRTFLAEAHARGLRVITELVVNHTSDQHPWFQRSRRAPPGSSWRNFYVWSETAEKYREARIIFRDFEPSNWTWDPLARAYYWHRFYSHQPDLNYEHPQVHKEIKRALDFWLDLGVDGLRLDAIPYLYERDGTSCENLPETHDYLKSLRRHVDEKYGDRMLLAEANQWPEDAVSYFGAGRGDESHMAFHFPLMPRMFMALRMEDRVPVVDILEQTPPLPETSQWALFLRNHDELTLEMVTDEERDYMYRVYANDAKARINLGIRRRLAPLLGNDRKRIELLYLLLFSLPGTPVLYYGDEIGMGDNIFLGDRNGVRTPMQWSSDKNAGFSPASPQALYLPIILDPEYHYEAINVEAQRSNPSSLFWWIKRTLTLRKRHPAFGRGSLSFLHPDNRKVLAFIRRWENEVILVVANLSRFHQPAHLNLAEFRNCVPVELMGRARFPVITERPYFVTLGPHMTLWFSLESSPPRSDPTKPLAQEPLVVPGDWRDLFQGEQRGPTEGVLASYLTRQTWFGGEDRPLKSVQIQQIVPLAVGPDPVQLLILLVEYLEGDPERYVLPVGVASGVAAERVCQRFPEDAIAPLALGPEHAPAWLHNVCHNKEFSLAFLEAMARRRSVAGHAGELRASGSPRLKTHAVNGGTRLEPAFLSSPQHNHETIFGDQFVLKLFRKVEGGTNPELEMGRFLSDRSFPNAARVAGSLDYRGDNGEEITVGLLTEFIPRAQDAWAYTLDLLSRYFDRVRAEPIGDRLESIAGKSIWELSSREVPEPVLARLGTYTELARLLGQRTAELHRALAADAQDRAFAPEPFTPFYQRALFQSMRNLAVRTLEQLRGGLEQLPEPARAQTAVLLERRGEILQRLRVLHETPLEGKRIRCHGDLHLGETLFTGKDFVFIDFEGPPQQSFGERRIKRSPLRDVATMIRSLDYISIMAVLRQVELGALREPDLPSLEPWARFWHRWVCAIYFQAYLRAAGDGELLPRDSRQLSVLLEAHLTEKAFQEAAYEMRHRPHLLRVPLRALLELPRPKGAG
jgi:maltose alpha-D-glucosyltransferase / alpha-amylase